MNTMMKPLAAGILGLAMLSPIGASATGFYGYAGCDRALDGAQKALKLAFEARDLPSNDTTRTKQWTEAMNYNQACYDVARALCGSAGGFLHPPASRESIGLCQAMLDDTHTVGAPVSSQSKRAVAIGGGLHRATIDIRLGYDGSDDTIVKFECFDAQGHLNACKSTNIHGTIGGMGTPVYVRSPSRLPNEDPVLKCRSHYRDFSNTTIRDLRPNVVSRGNIDESRMKCEFYALESFRVVVQPKQMANVPKPVDPEMPDEEDGMQKPDDGDFKSVE